MLKAKDIMARKVITVKPDAPITEVAALLLKKGINGAPVVNDRGELVGLICQSDLVAQQKKLPVPSVFNLLDSLIPINSPSKLEKEVRKIYAVKAEEAMSTNPVTVNPETSLEDIAALMVDRNFHTIPVVDKGKLVGIIGKEDVLRTIVPSG